MNDVGDDEGDRIPALPPLVRAAQSGNQEEVGRLLAAGASVEQSDETGWTALHAAASKGRVEIVDDLLAAGALVDARTWDSWTPLLNAAGPSSAEAVASLLRAGADVQARDGVFAWTPVSRAADYANAEVLDLLLRYGGDPNALSASGTTPLMCAAEAGSAACVKLLLDAGARSEDESGGETAASLAAKHGHAEVTAALRRR